MSFARLGAAGAARHGERSRRPWSDVGRRFYTERDGRKGLSAGDKTGRNRKRTPQSEAKTKVPNPHTGRKASLNHLSRGLSKTAHRGPASGSRRDVHARPTQGRVAPAQGNAKLPERPRDNMYENVHSVTIRDYSYISGRALIARLPRCFADGDVSCRCICDMRACVCGLWSVRLCTCGFLVLLLPLYDTVW
jgi:hypothetical protein